MQVSWCVAGNAGFGITTAGRSLARIAARSGLNIKDWAEFPSLIRGGFTFFEMIMTDSDQVPTIKKELDIFIPLTQASFDILSNRLSHTSIVIYDPEDIMAPGDFTRIEIPLNKIKKENKAYQVMINTVVLGASCKILGFDFNYLKELIIEEFGRKGQEVIEYNEKLAKIGYESAKKDSSREFSAASLGNKKMVLNGNEAFSLGAVIADCKAYFAYPMSPATSVLTTLAGWSENTGMVIRHVEDEVGVINEALGASFAGARVAVGTSGGGFALMSEAISYAGIAEIPIVSFLSMRPGPATGLPTWTGQGDFNFAVHTGHGEFPKIILAPGSIEEMLRLSLKAFDLADYYQTPVIVLSDKHLSESHESIDMTTYSNLIAEYKINRGKITTESHDDYKRYQDSPDGISPLLIPGIKKDVHWQANSYEHLENSHTTEEAHEVMKQVEKRGRKQNTYLHNKELGFELPISQSTEDADIILVGWGSTKLTILNACKMLREQGVKVGCVHFTHIFPLDPEAIRTLEYFNKSKKIIMIEENFTGQFAEYLRAACGVAITHSVKKYDGRPIKVEEIVNYIQTSL